MATVLLADDDKGALDLVRRALVMDGHTVTTVEDGNEALAALQSAAFDVLVADVDMPGLDGISLGKQARGIASGIALVFMSGSQELLDKAAASGMRGARTLIKPCPIEKIRSEIRSALAG